MNCLGIPSVRRAKCQPSRDIVVFLGTQDLVMNRTPDIEGYKRDHPLSAG